MELPEDKKALLDTLVAALKQIDGIKAIVLGGSWSTGHATAQSDVDIGLYYSSNKPFDLDKIRKIAQLFAVFGAPTVTGFYEWGPWVNGGAWIETSIGKVDFLYKNLEQISSTIENAKNGVWENHFEQQPPFGFSSITYLAETKYCISLYDPEFLIEKLKKEVQVYPVRLRQAVVQQCLWSAEFTIWQAASFASKADVYNTVGCLTRALKSIVSALFALNELYPMGDKRAMEILERAPLLPKDFTKKVQGILCCDRSLLPNHVAALNELFNETVSLAAGLYKPYYTLT